MNSRIRELYRQAHRDGFFGMAFDPEKFAELIVRECANFVDEAIGDGGIDGRSLKEHFGVK